MSYYTYAIFEYWCNKALHCGKKQLDISSVWLLIGSLDFNVTINSTSFIIFMGHNAFTVDLNKDTCLTIFLSIIR